MKNSSTYKNDDVTGYGDQGTGMLRFRRQTISAGFKPLLSQFQSRTGLSGWNTIRLLSVASQHDEKPGAMGVARDILTTKDHNDPKSPRVSNAQSIKRILGLLKPEVKPLGLAISTLGVTTTISLVFPAVVGQILDIAIAPSSSVTPTTIALGMLGLFTVQTVFMGIRTTLLANMGDRVANRIRK